jgi:hypothetical protein
MCIYLSISLSIHPSIYPSIYLSTYPAIYLSIYVYTYIHMHICVCVCLYVYSMYVLSAQRFSACAHTRVRPALAWPQVPLDAKAYTAEVQRVLVIAQRPCADRCVRPERMHACGYTCTCRYGCRYVYIDQDIEISTYVYVYIYIYIHIDTYISI